MVACTMFDTSILITDVYKLQGNPAVDMSEHVLVSLAIMKCAKPQPTTTWNFLFKLWILSSNQTKSSLSHHFTCCLNCHTTGFALRCMFKFYCLFKIYVWNIYDILINKTKSTDLLFNYMPQNCVCLKTYYYY